MRLLLAVGFAVLLGSCSSGDSGGSTTEATTPGSNSSTPSTDDAPVASTDPSAASTVPAGGASDPAPTTEAGSAAPTTDAVTVDPTGPGGAVVIAGDEWRFSAEECFTDGGLALAGAGVGPDGQTAWVDVNLDESVDLDGDGQLDSSAVVAVEVGRTDGSEEPDEEQPLFYARATRTGAFGYSEFEFMVADGRMSGSGTIQDYHSVAVPFGEPVEFSFDVACE